MRSRTRRSSRKGEVRIPRLPQEARPSVKEFYRLNHRHQTLDFVRAEEAASTSPLDKRQMGIWEAMEYLNTLVDDSDPDTDLSQIEHLMQTAEAIRARRPPALVHPHRPDPRPGQDPLPVRRAAVGRRRRHLPGRLRATPTRSSSPSSSPTTPTARSPNTRPPCGIYERRLRAGQGPPVVGPRRVPVPRRQGLPARGGAWP